MNYAVIRSGGKQYRVSPGETVRLENLAVEMESLCDDFIRPQYREQSSFVEK